MSQKSAVCVRCHRTAYALEIVMVDGVAYHKKCFRCLQCNARLTMNGYAMINTDAYCKPHYKQMFAKSGGRYDRAFGSNFDRTADPQPLSPSSQPLTPSSSLLLDEDPQNSLPLASGLSPKRDPSKSPKLTPTDLELSPNRKSKSGRKKVKVKHSSFDLQTSSGRSTASTASEPALIKKKKRQHSRNKSHSKETRKDRKHRTRQADIKLPSVGSKSNPASPVRHRKRSPRRRESPQRLSHDQLPARKSSRSRSPKRSKSPVIKQRRHRSTSPPKSRKKPPMPVRQHTSVLCQTCARPAYAQESIRIDDGIFHKTCFRCQECNNRLTLNSFAVIDSQLYCKPHYKQIFERKKPEYSSKSDKFENTADNRLTPPRRISKKPETKRSSTSPINITVSQEDIPIPSTRRTMSAGNTLTHALLSPEYEYTDAHPVPPLRGDSLSTFEYISEGRCKLCFAKINDDGISAEGTTFHRDCFKCLKCNVALTKDNFWIGDLGGFCLKHSDRPPATVTFLEPPQASRKRSDSTTSVDTLGIAVPKSLPGLERALADRDPNNIPARIAAPDPKLMQELNFLRKSSKILEVRNKTLEKEKLKLEKSLEESKGKSSDLLQLKQECDDRDERIGELQVLNLEKDMIIEDFRKRVKELEDLASSMERDDKNKAAILVSQIKEKDEIILRHTTHLEKLNKFISSQKSERSGMQEKVDDFESRQAKYAQEIQMLKQQRVHMANLIQQNEGDLTEQRKENANLRDNIDDLRNEIRRLEDKTQASSYGGTTPVPGSQEELEDTKKALKTAKRHVEVLTEDRDRLTTDLLEARTSKKEVDEELASATEQLELRSKQIKELRTTIDSQESVKSEAGMRLGVADAEEKTEYSKSQANQKSFPPSQDSSSGSQSVSAREDRLRPLRRDSAENSGASQESSRSSKSSSSSKTQPPSKEKRAVSKTRTRFSKLIRNRGKSDADDQETATTAKQVDEYLAVFLSEGSNISDTLKKLQLEKIDKETLLFGTKRIHIKVLSDQLSVRSSSGYVPFEQYVEKHAEKEIKRLERKQAKKSSKQKSKKRTSLFPFRAASMKNLHQKPP